MCFQIRQMFQTGVEWSFVITPRVMMRTLLGVLAVEIVAGFPARAAPPEQNRRSCRTPISVIASTTGDFAKGHSWHLSVNSAGRAHLTIDTYPNPQSREFNVGSKQFDQLVAVLERERFFALKTDYGESVPDGSTDTITIVKGDVAHTVSIRFLMNWVHSAPSKLKEPARAVRVFEVVRGWFADKEAVDLKKYDDMVLQAAGKE
jgi:hypothetical protein